MQGREGRRAMAGGWKSQMIVALLSGAAEGVKRMIAPPEPKT